MNDSSAKEIPNFVVHYSRGEPFRTLSGSPRARWASIVEALDDSNAWGLSRFSDPKYLNDRLLVEERLRERFIAKGGTPTLAHPIYFFLGRNSRFEEHKANIGYRIDLSDISPGSISFTYGDSMLSFVADNRKKSGPEYSSPLCETVYERNELESLLMHRDFPKESPLSIEAQLWIVPSMNVVRRLER